VVETDHRRPADRAAAIIGGAADDDGVDQADLPPTGGEAPAVHRLPAVQIGTYVGYGVAAGLVILGVVLLVRSFVVKPAARRPAAPYASLTARLLGRSRRRQYWLSWVGLAVLLAAATGLLRGSWAAPALVLPLWIWVSLRRLHDFDAPSWLAWLVPSVDLVVVTINTLSGAGTSVAGVVAGLVVLAATPIYVLVIGLIPGTKGPNRFGPAHGEAAFDAAVFD
jgi:uncharacterized membrane protein YhaH (DUF805 family)